MHIAMQLPEHYKDVAQEYDYYYKYIYELFLEAIKANVQIRPDDHVLDLGCGTGQFSHMVWKSMGLNNCIRCIEPSEDMLRAANGKEGLITEKATAEEFFGSYTSEESFRVILMTNCFHHFSHPAEVLSGIARMLPKDGFAVITTHRSQLPMVRVAETYLKTRVDSTEGTLKLIEEAGLKAELKIVVKHYNIDKSFWYKFMRKRMYSFYRRFTDAEIEAGIAELEEKFGDVDQIEIKSTVRLIIITP